MTTKLPYSWAFRAALLAAAACHATPPEQVTVTSACQPVVLPQQPLALPAVSQRFRAAVLADSNLREYRRPAYWVRGFDTTNVVQACARRFDFEPLWLHLNGGQLGYVDTTYTRLRLRFDFILRDAADPTRYWVRGRCRVDSVTVPLQGYFRLTHARQRRFAHPTRLPLPSATLATSRGLVLGEYHLAQYPPPTRPVVLRGVLLTNWFTDAKGQLRYDDEDLYSNDFFNNNSFVGTWSQGPVSRPGHWGDHRVFGSNRTLDIGAGNFAPDIERYPHRGWESMAYTAYPTMMEGDTLRYLQAMQEECSW